MLVLVGSFLFGLVIGSFLNVLILRHKNMPLQGRSMCLSCKKQIRWYDNIPIFSWILLSGKCRNCSASISLQYPLVELITAVLFALVAYPYLSAFTIEPALALLLHVVIAWIVIALLIALALYDLWHTILPDVWVYPWNALALFLGIISLPEGGSIALQFIAGPMTATPLFILWLVSRGAWMGFGDVKLALGMGWLLGPIAGFLALTYAFIGGAIISVVFFILLPRFFETLHKKGIVRFRSAGMPLTMKSEVPFGPYLITSSITVWFAVLYGFPLTLWL